MNKKLIVMSAMSLMLFMAYIKTGYAEPVKEVAPATEPTSNSAVSSNDSASPANAQLISPQSDKSKTDVKNGSATHKVLGDVVVSAAKIEQSSVDAPGNVTVITSTTIEKTNNERVGDALFAKVPGIYLNGGAQGNARPGVTSTSSMRGIGGTLTSIAVMVDGMNMVDAYSGQVNWSMVSMDDVDRIEVVPGVGSSLYGGNAMGGLINITTKEPTKKEEAIKAGKGFGDSSGKYASAIYRNKFENGLGVVFGLSENDRDGYIQQYITKTPSGAPAAGAVVVNGAIPTTTITGTPTYIVGDQGKNASTEKDVHAKLYYDLSATSKIHAGFAYSDNKSVFAPYNSYLTNAGTGSAVPINTTATNLNLNGKGTSIAQSAFFGSVPMGNTAGRFFGGYDGDVFGNSKLSVNFGKIVRDSWNSSAGVGATLTSGAGTLSDSPNNTTNATAQLTTPVGERHLLITGVGTEIGTLNQKTYATSNWTDMNSKTAVINQVDARSVTNSLFVEDQIAAAEKLVVYLSGRYDSWKAGGSGQLFAVNGQIPASLSYADRSDSAFSPKLAGVYKISEGFSIKSSIGTGFRPPTNYYMFANPTFSGAAAPNGKMIYSNPNLKPETVHAFDLGTEMDFEKGGNVKATYFLTKTTDLIYQNVTAVPTYTDPIVNKVINFIGQQQNTGSAMSRGIELAGSYPVMNWLTVSGNYSYTYAVITSDLTNTGMYGKRMTYVPQNTAGLALEAKQGDWSGVLSGRFVGAVFTANNNSDVFKNVYTGYSAYTVADLKAGYQITHNLKVNMMVDNLFNREYYQYYRMPGRGEMIELAGKF